MLNFDNESTVWLPAIGGQLFKIVNVKAQIISSKYPKITLPRTGNLSKSVNLFNLNPKVDLKMNLSKESGICLKMTLHACGRVQ